MHYMKNILKKMREIFVDTNVLIDFASETEPYATYAGGTYLIEHNNLI